MQSKLLAEQAQTIWGAACTVRQAAVSCPAWNTWETVGGVESTHCLPHHSHWDKMLLSDLRYSSVYYSFTFFYYWPSHFLYCSVNQYPFILFKQYNTSSHSLIFSVQCEMRSMIGSCIKQNSQLCGVHWDVLGDFFESTSWTVHESTFTWAATGACTVNKTFSCQTSSELLHTCNQVISTHWLQFTPKDVLLT